MILLIFWTYFNLLNEIINSWLAFNEVGGYEEMLNKYRYETTADPEYAAYTFDEETGENKSCR